ncbi:redoxin domain-containing protein [Pedobacter sp. HMF7647]|uniref:Redoxin domain-containing protein n=1 Tax=Hufsiella arboris TaxID=2695275 RepID=A0A7K1Y4C4_9SPHI|nr:TlpA disulfide reductase family protein [Hufsiella arboris]MXV49422.1 redoxin domain-containing protein [Hufsiella arboris]
MNVFKVLVPALVLVPSVLLAQQNYVLKGKVGKLNSPSKLFLTYSESGERQVDSALLKDGSFEFKGTVQNITQAALVVDYKGVGIANLDRKAKQDVLSVYLANGTTSVTSADSLLNAKISGTKVNEDGQQYQALLKPATAKIQAINQEYMSATPEQKQSKEFSDKLEKRYNEAVDQLKASSKAFIQKNPSSYVSLVALASIAGGQPDVAEIGPLFKSLSADLKSTDLGKQFATLIDAEAKTGVGAVAMDFTQNDSNGKPVKLSDFKGKYVLVDFWASWCGPCRQENPNVVKAYNRFKDKNFTVLGISLDRPNGKEAWLKAIKDDGLAWTQVSDLKFWNNEVAVMYGVRSIPQNYLIDPAGKIIGKNLRGEELEAKLEEVTKNM